MRFSLSERLAASSKIKIKERIKELWFCVVRLGGYSGDATQIPQKQQKGRLGDVATEQHTDDT